jgi:hypothetical protein
MPRAWHKIHLSQTPLRRCRQCVSDLNYLSTHINVTNPSITALDDLRCMAAFGMRVIPCMQHTQALTVYYRHSLAFLNVQTKFLCICQRPQELSAGLGSQSSDLCSLLSDIHLWILCHLNTTLDNNSAQKVASTGSDTTPDHSSTSPFPSVLVAVEQTCRIIVMEYSRSMGVISARGGLLGHYTLR